MQTIVNLVGDPFPESPLQVKTFSLQIAEFCAKLLQQIVNWCARRRNTTEWGRIVLQSSIFEDFAIFPGFRSSLSLRRSIFQQNLTLSVFVLRDFSVPTGGIRRVFVRMRHDCNECFKKTRQGQLGEKSPRIATHRFATKGTNLLEQQRKWQVSTERAERWKLLWCTRQIWNQAPTILRVSNDLWLTSFVFVTSCNWTSSWEEKIPGVSIVRTLPQSECDDRRPLCGEPKSNPCLWEKNGLTQWK